MDSIVQTLFYMILATLVLAIAFIDICRGKIHPRLLLVLFLCSPGAVLSNNKLSISEALGAAGVTFLLLSFLYLVSRKGIGSKDVLLCCCIAPYLGMGDSLAMVLLSMLLCGFAALLLLLRDRVNRNRKIPFSPFAAAATIIMLLF